MQVVIVAENGKNDESFVAVDEFTFLQTDVCDFMPSEAVPTEPPTTPTPTEPPGRKVLIYLKAICSSGFPFRIRWPKNYSSGPNGKFRTVT